MPLEYLMQRMKEHNDSIEALSSVLRTNAVATINIKKQLFAQAHDNLHNFERFSEANEVAAIAKLKEDSSAMTTLADHLSKLKGDEFITNFPTDISHLKFSRKSADDLGVEEDDVPDEVHHAPEDTQRVAAIYKIPDAAEKIVIADVPDPHINTGTGESFALNIVLNEKQAHAKAMAKAGKSYVLIGPAGSGKTTAQRSVAEELVESDLLTTCSFKGYDRLGGRVYRDAPSIAFCAFTRRAAQNLAKAILKSPLLAEKLPANIMTIHSLLEFEPEEYYDREEGKDKFRFAPKRTAENPLTITHLIIEESSMLGLDLWQQLYDALPYNIQIIFIGDINQLPPVFGPSILNYALVQLPIVELTETYRNQGIVLENAHHILRGEAIEENEHFKVLRGKSGVQHGPSALSFSYGNILKLMHEKIDPTDGLLMYDPEDCVVLSPWNKHELGTDYMNKWIAQFLGEKRGAIVHEVIASRAKHYLAVGDKVMFNKRDAIITDIKLNSQYHGKAPQLPGSDLTRFGVRVIGAGGEDTLEDISLDFSNFTLEALEEEKAERKQQCSHVVTLLYDGGEATEELSAAGDFGTQVFSLGYALTVHKAQGSEWRKVFIILHPSHAVSLYRELFYTAVTRARTKVLILGHDKTIDKAIKNQRIKGNSLKDKLEYFNSGADMRDGVYAYKT